MFEHFTFGAVAQVHDQADVPASPTNCHFPSPTWPASRPFDDDAAVDHEQDTRSQPSGMKEILQGFASQSIRANANEFPQRSRWMALPSPQFSVDSDEESTEGDIQYHSTIRGMVTAPSSRPPIVRAHPSSNSRLRRQHNVQLQTCHRHVRDISTLVEEMVESNSQCSLQRAPSARVCLPPPPAGREEMDRLALDTRSNVTDDRAMTGHISEDEGFAEMDDAEYIASIDPHISLRGSSTPNGIRKYKFGMWRSSAECVMNPASGQPARRIVRSKPRMRKRKPHGVPDGLTA